jgi:hypothetical protein
MAQLISTGKQRRALSSARLVSLLDAGLVPGGDFFTLPRVRVAVLALDFDIQPLDLLVQGGKRDLEALRGLRLAPEGGERSDTVTMAVK